MNNSATATATRPAPLRRAGRMAFAAGDLVANVLRHVQRLVTDVTKDSLSVASEAHGLWSEARDWWTLSQSELVKLQIALRGFPRAARLVGEVARLVALHKIRGATPAQHAESARRLHDLAVELRGGVLKVGQLASCRVDLLPPEYVTELARLQDRVPALPAEIMRARIEAEFGQPIDALFSHFDDTPIAAASIAQVHGARLPDGTEVVVKVQIPGVDELIAIDLAALEVIARLFGESLPRADFATILHEIQKSVRGELDFRAEAAATEAMRTAFAGDQQITVPRVHMASERVLVLERLPGQSLSSFLDSCEGERRDRVLATLARAYAAQILLHGSFQADAHPGNFIVLPDDRLGLIDFGATLTIKPEARRAYLELTSAILTGNAARMAELFQTMGFATLNDDPAVLLHFAEMMLGAFRDGVDLSSIDPQPQFAAAFELARENPVVRLPEEFVMIGRVFASLGGLFIRYQPKLSLFAALMPVLAEATARAASR